MPPMSAIHDSRHVIVTGGAGFIGSHLVERLIADEYAVTVIDDLSTGRMENLAAVRRNPKLRFIKSRVSDCRQLPRLAKHSKFIFHLAAAVGVELVVREPLECIQTNLRETEAALAAAGCHGTPILLASTSEVYGKSRRRVFSETDDLRIGPPYLLRWSYACSKLMDEFMALAWHRSRGLPVIIARLFNTVGPRQTGRFGMVLPRFIEAAKSGRPLRVYGSGRQTRCFCYVKDTVEALCRLQHCEAARGEIINIGGTEEISILELAHLVISVLNSRSPIEKVPYEKAYSTDFEDMLRRRPSINKLIKLTGFRPETPLEKIIEWTAK